MEAEEVKGKEQFYGKRTHFNIAHKRFKKEYNSIAKDNGGLFAFHVITQINEKIKRKLQSLKEEVDLFSEMLTKVLVPEENIERDTDLYSLHKEIEINAEATFNSETAGNFMHSYSDKDFLQDKLKKYLKGTQQKGYRNLIRKVPLAYKKRYLADKLHHQKLALSFLIEEIIKEDYPQELPKEDQEDLIEQFLKEKESTRGANSPSELYRDIHKVLSETDYENNPELFKKNGKRNISKTVDYALDSYKNENGEYEFFNKWGETADNNDKGLSKRWLKEKFKEINEALFKN